MLLRYGSGQQYEANEDKSRLHDAEMLPRF
jgi:hypothetical protein